MKARLAFALTIAAATVHCLWLFLTSCAGATNLREEMHRMELD